MKLTRVAHLLDRHYVTNSVMGGAVLRCSCGKTFHCPSAFEASMSYLKHAGFITDGPQRPQDEPQRPLSA